MFRSFKFMLTVAALSFVCSVPLAEADLIVFSDNFESGVVGNLPAATGPAVGTWSSMSETGNATLRIADDPVYEGLSSLNTARPGSYGDGHWDLTGTGVAANSGNGVEVTLTLAFQLDGTTGVLGLSARNGSTDLARFGIWAGGGTGSIGVRNASDTNWYWLTQSTIADGWNDLVIKHTNGTTSWSVSTNGSAFETKTGFSTTSNWDSLYFAPNGNATYAHLDAINLLAVPEPSTLVLLATGLLGLLAYAWRKRRQ